MPQTLKALPDETFISLQSRSDVHAFVRERHAQLSAALATTEARWRAVRRVSWALLVAGALGQYYFMDTLAEAHSLKSVVFTVPSSLPASPATNRT